MWYVKGDKSSKMMEIRVTGYLAAYLLWGSVIEAGTYAPWKYLWI